MVDGDNVCLQVICRDRRSANVGSVGNLQVYRSPTKGCSQTVKGRPGGNTLCVFNSDPVVLHSGSRFEQKQEWNVHPESSLLVAEWVIAGQTGNRRASLLLVSIFLNLQCLLTVIPWSLIDSSSRPDQLDYHDPALVQRIGMSFECVHGGSSSGLALENVLAKEIDAIPGV